MSYKGMGKISITLVATLLFFSLASFRCLILAGDPHSAYYSSDNDKVFWFIHASDIHMGMAGNQDIENLEWIVSEAKDVIDPEFIVITGDLTDSTNGSVLGMPDGPWQDEWDEYRQILEANGVDETFYYDIPGNHDHYNDPTFAYYLNNSIQGRATGQMQISWTRDFPFGKYHFIGICTAGNDGAAFSLTPPYFGDNAGLDADELAFINNELENNQDSDITLIFGHHQIKPRSWPLTSADEWTETALSYGADEFVELMDDFGVSMYGYGHSHLYREELFTENMTEGVYYLNAASLGESSENHYNIVAIDCNGISAAPQSINTWPAVLITAPLDKLYGIANNPYRYRIPNSDSNPIRALVFDLNPVTQVQYRIDGTGAWYPMESVGTAPLWEAQWDDTSLPDGDHTIEVQAFGTTTRTDAITVEYDFSAPTVISTNPSDSVTEVDVDMRITATFSRAMDSSTLTTDTFLIHDGSTHISGTVSFSDTICTFAPTTGLNYGTTYTASITTSARDLSGKALETEFMWSFTTESEEEWYEQLCFISTAAHGFRMDR